MKSLFVRFCFLAYIISFVVFTLLAIKIANVRSSCTKERAKISKLLIDIKEFKDENNRLLVKFYSSVRPGLVDTKTKDMEILKESGVKYLR